MIGHQEFQIRIESHMFKNIMFSLFRLKSLMRETENDRHRVWQDKIIAGIKHPAELPLIRFGSKSMSSFLINSPLKRESRLLLPLCVPFKFSPNISAGDLRCIFSRSFLVACFNRKNTHMLIIINLHSDI